MTGLSPNTTYYVRVYATNAAGTDYGNKDNHSNQRCPNGSSGWRNTSNYTQTNPTPGAYNCAPDLDLNDSDTGSNNFTAAFTEDAGAVNITDTDVKVTDPDDTNIDSAIILTNRPNGTAESPSLSGGLLAGISETDSYDNADGKMVLYFGWIY